MELLQMLIVIALFVFLVIPLGSYLYKVSQQEKTFLDFICNPIDSFIYKITGVDKEEMNWKHYIGAILLTNAVMAFLVYLLFRIQGLLGLNPNGAKAMDPSLAFNTAISFITNTNLQHYSGERDLTYFTQMGVITFLMFTAAATGFSAALAFTRGITGKSLGNYYVDLVRVITRVLLPLAFVVTLLLVWQGTPQTLSANQTVTTIEDKLQDIPLGPVASLESIKHIGTNGGGFFGANAAHPFENPTPLTNIIHLLSMMMIPGALVYTFGLMVKNKKQGWTIFGAMSVLFLVFLTICYISEKAGNPVIAQLGLQQSVGNMEGKEIRFGVGSSAFFTTVTTAFTTGTVNNMHDSLTPLGGMAALGQMMLNVVFGGKGVGLMNMLMFAILSVFLCGLMVGRTPEFLSKKIEGKEMKLIALTILIHPFIILIPSAIALLVPEGTNAITNPGFHGLSQVIYEFTSSAANNGSGFEGLVDNTPFWNVSTGLIMLLGRYLPMIALLAVAGSLSAKKPIPVGDWTFKTDTSIFGIILIAVVLVVGALTFFPVMALGPISEHLTLIR